VGIPFRIGLKDAAILALTKGRYWKGLAIHLLHFVPAVFAAVLGLGVVARLVRRLPEILPWLRPVSAEGPWLLLSALSGRDGVPIATGFAGVWILSVLQTTIGAALAVCVLAVALLVAQPMGAGLRDWYRRNRAGSEVPPDVLFLPFEKRRYAIVVHTFVLRFVRLAPWFLPGAIAAVAASLLVALRYATDAAWLQGASNLPPDSFTGLTLPVLLAIGIVLAAFLPAWIRDYAFRPVPWILSALPGLSPRDIVRLAERMTRGHRLDLFLLDLSFAGWAISSLFTCGTGLLFLAPYYEAVQAETHARLAEEAEREGYLVRRSRSSRGDQESSRIGFP